MKLGGPITTGKCPFLPLSLDYDFNSLCNFHLDIVYADIED